MKLRKNVKRGLLLVGIILVVLIVSIVLLNSKKEKEVEEVKVINEIKEYGYQLRENETEKYKRLFKELKEILEKEETDEESYAKTIAEMFIIDFYTLKDKEAKTDVGGVDFLNKEARVDFLEKAMDTLYKYVESNIYGDRTQELPEVDKVEVQEVNKVSFHYLDKEDSNAYEVKLTWTYQKDLGYDTKATITFVHEDNKLSIVEIK